MTTLAETASYQILIMFLIIITGVVCYKVKLVDKVASNKLSELVLMLVNPVVIFVSYQREFESTLLKGLLISLVMAVMTHVFGILLTSLILRKKKQRNEIAIERFAVIYSNCGFIGIPLVSGIFGSEGVFYLTAYMTVFNLFIWTHGVIVMTGKRDIKTITRAFLSPSVIATLFGFVFFVVRIQIPEFTLDTLNYIGGMNTPLAMLVAGVTIAQTDIKKILFKIRIYYIALLKLIVVPIVMLFVFRLFDIPKVVLLTSILASACPTAVTINLFSLRYNKNYYYASELFAVTTIFSIITIPLVMSIAEFFV